MKTARQMMHGATIDDIEEALQSPAYFHVKVRLRSDGVDGPVREMAVGSVSTRRGDRHLVLGDMPAAANPILVEESDITNLGVVFDCDGRHARYAGLCRPGTSAERSRAPQRA
jgi:hypothetical protein